MKKTILLAVITVFMISFGFAQKAEHFIGKVPSKSTVHAKTMNSTITCASDVYVAGATVDLTFIYTHITPDGEWVDGVSLDFPAGVTVNSSPDFALTWNSETGDGALTSWGNLTGGSGNGPLRANATFTVNVTFDASFTGNAEIAWFIAGDGYGEAPHTNTGTISLNEALTNDLAVIGFTPVFVMSGNSVYPTATLRNMGSVTQNDFEIEFVISDGTSDVYTSTLSVTGAALAGLNSDEYVMVDEWINPAEGDYTITVTVSLDGDLNTDNDEITGTCLVSTYSDLQAANTTQEVYFSINIENGDVSVLGTVSTEPFPMAEEFDGNVIYRIYNDFTYGVISPIGDFTLMGTFAGVAGTPVGLAYDWDNDLMYVMVLTADNLPNLCTANMTTGVLTSVGIGTVGMIIGIDFANDGFIYGPSLDDDILYKIDPATGATTAIGALGLDINFGQDVSYDKMEDRLYTVTCGAAYLYGYYDLTTGAFVEIADMDGDQYGTFVITREPNLTLADILEFSFAEQTTPAVIDQDNMTVSIEVGFGTDVTELIADFVLSYAATASISGVEQVSGVTENDFTNPVVYAVKSGDESVTNEWTVTVTVADLYTETKILAFSFPQQTAPAVIDQDNYTVDIEVAYGTDATSLVASYILSYGASASISGIEQVSGVTQNNFTDPVVYTILAEDNIATQDWTINVSVEVIPEGQICASAANYGYVNDPPQSGSIESLGAYWYYVTIPGETENVVFSLCTGTNFDTQIEVWEACDDATYLLYNDDACDLQSEVTAALLSAGVYYVKVYAYGDNSGNYTLTITGTVLTGPQLASLTPENDAVAVELDATVSATFADDIFEADFSGITILPNPGNVSTSISGNVLTIAHDDFDYNTVYTVTIPAESINDGTDPMAMPIVWSFTTKLDPLACNDPSNIIASAITHESATISWTENGPSTEWLVLYGEEGFDPATEGTEISVNTSPTTDLTELNENTSYDVYVMALCALDEESDWTGPYTFTTLVDCGAAISTLPYTNAFDIEDPCWTIIQSNTNETWAHDGTGAYSCAYDAALNDQDEWLISPEFDLSGYSSNNLNAKFTWAASYHWAVDPNDNYDMFLKVTTDGTTWATIWDESQAGVFEDWVETLSTVDVSAFAGESFVKFAFNYVGNDGAQWLVHDFALEIVSAEPIENSNIVSVYPNPSSGLVNIEVTENSVVSIVDIAGRTISTYNLNANETINFTQSAGMYVVKVESNGKVSTHKLVIQ